MNGAENEFLQNSNQLIFFPIFDRNQCCKYQNLK
jgi:hypothetical protein